MKEKELIALGFERTDVTAEESGCESDWYYYTYGFGKGALNLISCDNAEAEKDGWYAEIFEDETIRFTNSSDMMALIDIINRNIVK